jgi:hypothetical protein
MSSINHPPTCRCHACACCQEEDDHHCCAECRAIKGCPEDCECPGCSILLTKDEDFEENSERINELLETIKALTKEKDEAWAAYRRVKAREAAGGGAAPVKKAAAVAKKPAPVKFIPKPASAPTAEDYEVEIDETLCICRTCRTGETVPGYTPTVFVPLQCPNKRERGSDLCKTHQRIFEKMAEGDMAATKKWHNRLGEEVPGWSHIIGSKWFHDKAKWTE